MQFCFGKPEICGIEELRGGGLGLGLGILLEFLKAGVQYEDFGGP